MGKVWWMQQVPNVSVREWWKRTVSGIYYFGVFEVFWDVKDWEMEIVYGLRNETWSFGSGGLIRDWVRIIAQI